MEFSEFQLKEIFKSRKFSSPLKCLSGKKVEVIETGTANSDTGPDFKHALLRINGITVRGDIEFHRQSSDWYSHGHQHDRNYNSVVLHVVGGQNDETQCVTESGRKIEVLKLTDFLSADVDQFLKWLSSDERLQTIKCSKDNYRIAADEKIEYLRSLGQKRFAHKVGKFEERLKDIIEENRPAVFEAKQRYFKDFADLQIEHRTYTESELQQEEHWDQLLYEGILEGLGYTKNTAAFRKLARNMSLSFLREYSGGQRTAVEAMLFGAGGLLPDNLDGFDEESKTYCQGLSDVWRNLKKKYKREYVDNAEWFFFKLRPQNFPTLRIAGAAHLVVSARQTISAKALINSGNLETAAETLSLWRKFLIVPSRDYWAGHFIFGAPSTSVIRMLIGAGRAEEIIINTFLPLMYLRGEIFRKDSLKNLALRIFSAHPPTPDNNITLLVKENLFGGDNVFDSVIIQQGALHVYRSFCSGNKCERCKIGKRLFGKTAA